MTATRKCVFCGSALEKYPQAIPPWLNPTGIAKQHMGPIASLFTGRALEAATDTLDKYCETWICPNRNCGWFTFFEKKA